MTRANVGDRQSADRTHVGPSVRRGRWAGALIALALAACSPTPPTSIESSLPATPSAPAKISLAAPAGPILAGEKVTLKVAVTPAAAGVGVFVQRQIGSTWQPVTSGVSDVGGRILVSVPGADKAGRITFRAVTVDSSGTISLSSAPSSVSVDPGPTRFASLAWPKGEIEHCKTAVVSGSLLPREAGRQVSLEASKNGRQWQVAGEDLTGEGGAFRVTVPDCESRLGRNVNALEWRVRVQPTDSHAGVSSSPSRLRMAAAPEPEPISYEVPCPGDEGYSVPVKVYPDGTQIPSPEQVDALCAIP